MDRKIEYIPSTFSKDPNVEDIRKFLPLFWRRCNAGTIGPGRGSYTLESVFSDLGCSDMVTSSSASLQNKCDRWFKGKMRGIPTFLRSEEQVKKLWTALNTKPWPPRSYLTAKCIFSSFLTRTFIVLQISF